METPIWKLNKILDKLPVTNVLGHRLAEDTPPPFGFKWSKTF